METAKRKLFKPIFGCEMYVARRRLFNKEGKPDQSGYHLVVLAKNEKGYIDRLFQNENIRFDSLCGTMILKQ